MHHYVVDRLCGGGPDLPPGESGNSALATGLPHPASVKIGSKEGYESSREFKAERVDRFQRVVNDTQLARRSLRSRAVRTRKCSTCATEADLSSDRPARASRRTWAG